MTGTVRIELLVREERVAEESVGVQHETRFPGEVGNDDPLLTGRFELAQEGIPRRPLETDP